VRLDILQFDFGNVHSLKHAVGGRFIDFRIIRANRKTLCFA